MASPCPGRSPANPGGSRRLGHEVFEPASHCVELGTFDDVHTPMQLEARLLRNQTDIGNAIKPFYGAAAGNKLTSLLRTHILEAVPVLAAAKAGDKAKLMQALNAWYANARQIAVFLSKANPGNWPLKMMNTMMRQHLALTTKEAAVRLQGNWSADVRAYDQVHAEILQMADMLSSGIVRQFAGRF